MNRKQMLKTIAKQSSCSLRHVRKEIFKRAAENKRHYPHIKFYDALTNSGTNWIDYNKLEGPEKYRTVNTFDVCRFPSGIVVLFYVNATSKQDKDFIYRETFGARLSTTHFLFRN